jgi:hemoglobin
LSSPRVTEDGELVAESIFERYGGFAKVSRVVSAFYREVLDSPVLAPYFAGVDMRRLIDHQTKFFASLMGGPASYSDEHLARVHAHLHIDDDAFDELTMVVRDVLEDEGYAETDISLVHTAIVRRRPFIVSRPHAALSDG